MDQPDAEGAAAVGRHFVALYDYAFATGDVTGFAGISGDACEFCRSVIDDINTSRQASQHEEGGGTAVSSATGTMISPETFSAVLRVTQAASTRVTATDEVVSTTPASEFDLLLAITWSDGWSVEAVDVLDPGTVTAS